jgi:hypothetical protein
MNAPKYYTQVLANLESGKNPKSRDSVIREYFRLYLPSFSALAPNVIEEFISGKATYEEVLLIFRQGRAFQEARQIERVKIFDAIEAETYWPRSIPPLPNSLTRIPFELELERFREVFGPKSDTRNDVSRVPGTTEVYRNRFANLWGW